MPDSVAPFEGMRTLVDGSGLKDPSTSVRGMWPLM